MSDPIKPPVLPPNLGKAILEPLNHAIAAGEREALKIGVPTADVLEMLLNHLASIVVLIEPPGARVQTVKDIISALPTIVQKHLEARMTTPNGLLIPVSVSKAIENEKSA